MCGIAGMFGKTGRHDLLIKLKNMADCMAHRGPDGQGISMFGEDGAAVSELAADGDAACMGGFAHRRLAIIDLSVQAAQPMSDATGRFWMVYNGEVFNYREIRSELESVHGCEFVSASDSEVVLQAFVTWGEGCLHRFNGMWAFAVWDGLNRTLFLARDRFGIKPLYYHCADGLFSFASEIKPLLKLPHIVAKPDLVAVADFLAHGRVDALPRTFFKGIMPLESGRCAVYRPDICKLDIRQWWSLNQSVSAAEPVPSERWPERFRELFVDSVKLRLRSDVPIGTCLSGGLDSSAVACVAAPYLNPGNRNAFSARFANFAKDESSWVDLATEQAGLRQHWIEPVALDLRNDLDSLIAHQEQPFTSTSIYAQYKVFERARQEGVPVTLDGQGADESMAGYLYFFPVYHAELAQRGHLRALWHSAAFATNLHGGSVVAELARTAAGFFDHRSMIRMSNFFHPGRSCRWLSRDMHGLARAVTVNDGYHGGRLNRRLAEVFCSSGLPALLRYADRNSMAHSIESRMPFLDYRLVTFLFSLPAEGKISNGRTKAVMRDALAGILPEKIRQRHDKIGFETPEAQWFREVLATEMNALFCDPGRMAVAPWIKADKLADLWHRHLAGTIDSSRPLWRIFCLEKWMRRFIL